MYFLNKQNNLAEKTFSISYDKKYKIKNINRVSAYDFFYNYTLGNLYPL